MTEESAGDGLVPTDVGSVLLREFAFLPAMGFEVAQTSADAVTWRRGSRTFQVSRDWRDGFVDAHFGDDAPDGPLSFGLRQALDAIGRADLWPKHGWQAWKAETVEKYVVELAQIVQQNLADFLLDADDSWVAAHRLTVEEAETYWNDMRSRRWRSQASAARATGDWAGVVKAYGELVALGLPLSDAESARLRFAQRQVGSTGG
jgi:hypothetical protein